jgi:hypothetical protein
LPIPTPGTPGGSVLTLTFWLPEFLSPQAPQPVGPLLAQQLATFASAQSDRVQVQPVLKARYGTGGLLDFLLTAQPVAPTVLPDLVALDLTELEKAAVAGLLQPLDSLLDGEVVGTLYPFARAAGVFEDRQLAIQYIADIEHLVYLPNQVKVPPLTWSDLLQGQIPYLFPAGSPQPGSSTGPSESVQRAILSQYLAAVASAENVERSFVLRPEPLTQLLLFYEAGSKAAVLPPGITDLVDVDAVWSIFGQNRTPLAYVSARRYLAERDTLSFSGFAGAPGGSLPARPIASGWAFAIVTTDPARQRAAADLIATLLEPANAGAAARALGWLPVSPAALATWGPNPYFDFLGEQLAIAHSYPAGREFPQAAARLQRAAEAVLRGELAPAAAAETAISPSK